MFLWWTFILWVIVWFFKEVSAACYQPSGSHGRMQCYSTALCGETYLSTSVSATHNLFWDRREMGSPTQKTPHYSDLEAGTKNLTSVTWFQGIITALSDAWWIHDKGLLYGKSVKDVNLVMLLHVHWELGRDLQLTRDSKKLSSVGYR